MNGFLENFEKSRSIFLDNLVQPLIYDKFDEIFDKLLKIILSKNY